MQRAARSVPLLSSSRLPSLASLSLAQLMSLVIIFQYYISLDLQPPHPLCSIGSALFSSFIYSAYPSLLYPASISLLLFHCLLHFANPKAKIIPASSLSLRSARSSRFSSSVGSSFIFFYFLSLSLVACLIGLIIDRQQLLKFFICYELFFFTLSVILLIYSIEMNGMILVFYLLSNSTFEVIIGLSIMLIIVA